MKDRKLENKLTSFCSDSKQNEVKKDETVLDTKDGLFERVEFVNKKYITQDGRQLLKETLFER
jgi:hypothetical protein